MEDHGMEQREAGETDAVTAYRCVIKNSDGKRKVVSLLPPHPTTLPKTGDAFTIGDEDWTLVSIGKLTRGFAISFPARAACRQVFP